MKIHGVKLENFMLFDKLDAEFSPNINVICGENSTGKTALIKLLYACEKTTEVMRDRSESFFEKLHPGVYTSYENPYWFITFLEKLKDIFLPGSPDTEITSVLSNFLISGFAQGSVSFGYENQFDFSFGNPAFVKLLPEDFNHLVLNLSKSNLAVYIPPKEMISATENFSSLYKEYHIPFDETYYDLTKLLDRPRKKKLSLELERIIQDMETLIGGKVLYEGKKFFLVVDGDKKIPMSLVSEGYRKLATLLYLVSTGSLADGSILLWDEPETNMNPRMVEPLVKAILTLAGAGVQVFVTTHDYFVQQYFGLAAEFGDRYQKGAGDLEYRFLSLNREGAANGGQIHLESAPRLENLNHNAIEEEFDAIYDREQGMIYDDT